MTELLEKKSPSQQSLSSEMISQLRERAKRDLYFFAKGILGFDWLDKEIHLEICKTLEEFETETRVLICLPRGWLKTTLVSIAYPIWRAIKNPNTRILITQNTFTNACSKLRTIGGIFDDNPLFRMLFPDLLPDSSCVWKAESMCVKRSKSFPESTFEAAGTRTQVTSRHYDLIIEDDTVAPDFDELGQENLCPTKDDIDKAIGYHRLLPPLLIDPSKSQNIVVGTRWFEKDLISWIKANEKSFRIIERACRETEGIPDPGGEIVWPKRFGEKVLEGLQVSMGPYLYSCLYMNAPMRSEDMDFRQEWVRYYEKSPLRLAIYTTVDLADDPTKTKGKTDFNVVMTTGKDLETGRVFVLEYFHKKCNPGELIDAIFTHVRTWHPLEVGIEAGAYQGTVEYWIREKMSKLKLYFSIRRLTHGRRSKGMRIRGLQPMMAGGMLFFRRWMRELVGELLNFPLGEYDDLADALASQLQLWAMTPTKTPSEDSEEGDVMSLKGILSERKKNRKKSLLLEPLRAIDLDMDDPPAGMSWLLNKSTMRRALR